MPAQKEKFSATTEWRRHDQRLAHIARARARRQMTLSLVCLLGSIASLAPFLELHLTNRIGLLLFESQVLQTRSTLFAVIITLAVLVVLGLIIMIIIMSKRGASQRSDCFHQINQSIQKLLRLSSGLLAILSILAYLSVALIVPHIQQVQRMPLASFDCQANEISIENCPQQFASELGNLFGEQQDYDGFNGEHLEQDGRRDEFGADLMLSNLWLPLKRMLVGDLNGNSERFIRRLDCLRYNHRNLRSLRVPTRFLLHKCGLVCRPHREQVRQFSYDLNCDKQESQFNGLASNYTPPRRPLIAPYSQPRGLDP